MKKISILTVLMTAILMAAAQTIADIDGNTYPIVEIAGNEWMGENLRTSTYNDGTPIASHMDAESWKDLTLGAFAISDEIGTFFADYGHLYNGYAVSTGKLCPAGWHVPTAAQWQTMIQTLDPEADGNLNTLGNQLKSQRQVNSPLGHQGTHPRWDEHDTRYGHDDHGFAALPAGAVSMDGEFMNLGQYAYFWTSTIQEGNRATAQVLLHSHKGMSTSVYQLEKGFSVRCIKTDGVTPPPTQYTLTIGTIGNGSTTPAAGTYDFAEGTSVNLTATPDEGWEFEKWVIDGEDVMNPTTSVIMNDDASAVAHFTEIILPPTQYTLTIGTVGNGSTTPAAGTYEYVEGTSVDLTATPDEGWEFEKWVIDGEDVMNPTTSVIMNDDASAVAHFTEITLPPTQYTLIIGTVGNGSTTPAAGTYDFVEGTSVDLTATPDEGWEFEKWVIDGEDVINPTTSVIMNDDVSAVAHFTEIIIPPTQYTLTIETVGNGSTTPAAGTYDFVEGTSVDLTATPDEGWEFEKWVIDGEDVINPTTSVIMNDDVSAVAHFTEIIIPPTQYTLIIGTVGNGSTTPAAGTYDLVEGTSVDLTATPDEGWEFGRWVIDGTNYYSANLTITINKDIIATAHFTEEEDDDGLFSFNFEGQTVYVHDANHFTTTEWGGFFIETHATSDTDGHTNTQTIISVLGDNFGMSYAAKVCADLVAHGYSDWYLPSKEELEIIYENRLTIGNMGVGSFWSSTEVNEEKAVSINFGSGIVSSSDKIELFNIRCTRK